MLKRIPLDAGWQLKQRDPAAALSVDFSSADGWLAASVPGTVHQDLLAAGRIPDPFIGLNELDVQWIGEVDWLYRCHFELEPNSLQAGTVALCLDGLDTFATVWLNGHHILTSDNMFIPQRISVKPFLQPGQNDLWLLFESALRHGQERQAQYGVSPVWNGDPSRVYVRKAQYHYGWDWGPCLLTAGPWRPIRLEAYEQRIADLHCPVEVAPDLSSAILPASIEIEAGHDASANLSDLTAHLSLYDPAGELIDEATLPVEGSQLSHHFEVASPQLWWPNGYGAQPLYRLEVTLQQDTLELDRREQRLGIRRLRLLQEPLENQPGTTFLFEINNRPIFCGGANWIPADSFVPRITPERYRAWLQSTVDAHMTMLRVWGGGIYEEDIFYDLCDELGILIWQDFMFACGIYPARDWFQASVAAEAEAAVRRLRHHPSLALWSGNNEDYQIAQSINLYDASFEGDFTQTKFPARAIYERLLPSICERLDPQRPYWPGSPYGGPKATDTTVGDAHVWDVWHGSMAPYHDYPKLSGRFVSEFGMQAAPALETIQAFAPPDELLPYSHTFEFHNKATDGPRRLAAYLSDILPLPSDLEEYIYATQLLQAEALRAAYQGWRRQWAGPEHCAVSGALVWQLNDCWPVTSWAIIDYYLRPKPAYYVVRRALAPLTLGLAATNGGVDVWAMSSLVAPLEGTLELSAWTLDGQQAQTERQQVTLSPNQTTELGNFAFDAKRQLVVSARLLQNDTIVARAALWPEPFKYLKLPDPMIELTRLDEDTLRLRAARPAKGVWLQSNQPVQWSDNMLDLIPGDEQIITARGLGDAEVQIRWLK
jgi:beta-mannosidase